MTRGWRKLFNEELLPTKYYWGYHIQEGEMGMACNTHDRREKYVPDLRDHLEKPNR
jgi:hypothetical protein